MAKTVSTNFKIFFIFTSLTFIKIIYIKKKIMNKLAKIVK